VRTLADFFRCRARCRFSLLSRVGKRRVLDVVVPRELDQPPDRLRRFHLGQVEVLLLAPDLGVGTLQDGEKEVLLLAEVVVEHPLVDACSLRDAVHAGAAEAEIGELIGGRDQYRFTGGFGIPAGGSLSTRSALEHSPCYPTARLRYSERRGPVDWAAHVIRQPARPTPC
jgi:hypothetical protein